MSLRVPKSAGRVLFTLLLLLLNSCGLFSGQSQQPQAANVPTPSQGLYESAFQNIIAGFDGPVYQVLAVPGDPNSIYVTGGFNSYAHAGVTTPAWSLVKLSLDGTLNQSFTANSPFVGGNLINGIYLLQAQIGPDNNLYVYSSATLFGIGNNVLGSVIVRITPSGVWDQTFNTGIITSGTLNNLFSVAFSEDAKSLYLGGLLVDPITNQDVGILKFNLSTGALDTTFSAVGSIALAQLANNNTQAGVISIAPFGGMIYIAGGFTTSQGSGLARLSLVGSLDTSFPISLVPTSPPPTISTIPGDDTDLIFYYPYAYGNVPQPAYKMNASSGVVDPNFLLPFSGNGSLVSFVATSSSTYFVLGNYMGSLQLIKLNAEGGLDSSATPVSNVPNFGILSFVDGMVYVMGQFNDVGYYPANSVARFSPNLIFDTTFNVGSGINGPIAVMAQAPDSLGNQGALMAGNFNQYDGVSISEVALMRHNGSIEPNFNCPMTGEFQQIVSDPSGDGNFYISGSSLTYSTTKMSSIVRINSLGGLDSSFKIVAGTVPTTIAQVLPLNDGTNRILVAGTTVAPNSSNPVVLLKSNGQVDTSFVSPVVLTSKIYALALTDSGKKILIGGQTSNGGLLLKVDLFGNNDPNFVSTPSFPVSALAVIDPVAGTFYEGLSPFLTPGVLRTGTPHMVQRLIDNGTVDTSFAFAATLFEDIPLIKMASGNSGQLYATIAGLGAVDGIYRFNSDGSFDKSFSVAGAALNNGMVNTLFDPGDGTIWLGGNFNMFSNNVVNNIAVAKASDGSLPQ
jgi:hypothetical protein